MDDKSLIFSCLLFSLFLTSSAQTNCSTYPFSGNRLYATCANLPYLNAFLHWTYHPSNNSVDIAYRHTGVDTSTWVAWALNPSGGAKMPGAQALVALHNSSGQLQAYTSSIPTGQAGYITTLAPSPLTFQVPTVTADYTGTVMIIYATLVLPTGQTSFNQIWQDGPASGGSPGGHSTGDHLKSTGTVDFVTGQTTAAGNGLQRRRNVHGVLNAVSWGTLMPLGAMIARYLKVFKSADPAWFYLHIACQCSAYIIGVAGWATGLKLGSDSGIVHSTHRNIGITLFCLATLQVFALLLRPKKDHKYRLFWNIYHWSVGYVTIILSIVNIFEGLNILDPGKKWKRAYISILIFLGFNAAMLEAYTWYLFVKRRNKKTQSDQKHHPGGSSSINSI